MRNHIKNSGIIIALGGLLLGLLPLMKFQSMSPHGITEGFGVIIALIGLLTFALSFLISGTPK